MNHPQILKVWLGRTLMVVWLLALSLSMVCWGAWHYAALPGPVSVQLPRTETGQHWKLIHVLAADCGCSAAVAKRLVERHAQSGIFEEVWLVGDSPELHQTLDGAGFHVSQKNSETLAQEAGIEGLPCLLIINPAGRTVYAGGYARQNPATVAALEDLALLQRAQSGGVPDPLPLFGCAASQRLKLALDPLGLKYSSRPPMNRP